MRTNLSKVPIIQNLNAHQNAYMHEIICPHCSKAFKIDETGYAGILKQVRDSDLEQQLHDRLALAEQEKISAVDWTWSSHEVQHAL